MHFCNLAIQGGIPRPVHCTQHSGAHNGVATSWFAMKIEMASPPSCKSCSENGVLGSPVWCSKWGCNAHTACEKWREDSACRQLQQAESPTSPHCRWSEHVVFSSLSRRP